MAKLIVPESEIVEHIKEFIDTCDADELGRIAGELFGGKCFMLEAEGDVFDHTEYYEFDTNDFYMGEFGPIEGGDNG